MAKELLAYHKIRVPNFAIFSPGAIDQKAAASQISAFHQARRRRGVLRDLPGFLRRERRSARRIHFIHERMNQTALAEEYIKGREIYVSLIGNERLRVFRCARSFLPKCRKTNPSFTFKAKWDDALSQALGHPECFRRAVSRRHRPEHRKDLQGCLSRLAHSRLRPHRPAGDSGRRDRHPGSQPESQPGPRR